jgi:hypothetical protein
MGRWIFWGALVFWALCAAVVMATVPFPAALDELQHVSFIRWEALHPAAFPRYETMRVLTPDLAHWAGPTWLTHPSPYYHAFGLLDRLAGGHVLALRLTNTALSLAAIATMLRAAGPRLASDGERLVFGVVLVLFPKAEVVAGLVNNDNAALLVAALAFLGFLRWREGHGERLIGAALAAGGFVKLTVLVMLAPAFALLALLTPPRRWRDLAWPALGAALGLIPTLVNLARYGRPVWLSPVQYTPLEQRPSWSFARYALRFGHGLAETWGALEPTNAVALYGAGLALGFAAFAAARPRRRPVAAAMALAILPALAAQLTFGWRDFQAQGFIFDGTARYYYVLWPGVALGLAQLWGDARPTLARRVLTPTIALALAAGSVPVCFALLALAPRHGP